MSADQLIAEFRALPWAERRQVADAILSDEVFRFSKAEDASKEPTQEIERKPTFSERWLGKFSEPDSEEYLEKAWDARMEADAKAGKFARFKGEMAHAKASGELLDFP